MIYFQDGLGTELWADDDQETTIHYELRPDDYCLVDVISHPQNHLQKRQHHQRFCRLLGTYRYYYDAAKVPWLRATVKFLDDGKIGYIAAVNLLPVSLTQMATIQAGMVEEN